MTPLLELSDITKRFRTRGAKGSEVRALDRASISLSAGETLGIVGESGCGKSTLARIALRLIEPSEGTVRFEGQDITHLDHRALLPVRRRMQAIFQDPLGSFNPFMTIAEIMEEPFATHGLTPSEGIAQRSQTLLEATGLGKVDLSRRPNQFSGGQLQRIAIARALAVEPDVIVADEPTSALDPSIQAQVLNTLLDVQNHRGIAYVIISHDMDVIGHLADRVAVMYLGVVVEVGPRIMSRPLHPYTQALLSAAPTLKARRDKSWNRITLAGDPPSPMTVPSGCRFHPRCALAREICQTEEPPLRALPGMDVAVACHFAPEGTLQRGETVALARRGHQADRRELAT